MTLLDVIAWLIFGGLAGWIASMIMKTDADQGAVANIVVGVIGAVIGGFIARSLGGSGVTGFNIYSLLIAILGAIILLFLYKLVVGRRGSKRSSSVID